MLINGKTITEKFSIVKKIRSFFISVEKKLQHKIYQTRRYCSYYLKRPNPNTLFTSPTSTDEVKDNMQDLKANKSTGPNSLLIVFHF